MLWRPRTSSVTTCQRRKDTHSTILANGADMDSQQQLSLEATWRQDTVGLFDLPRELRDEIYELVLTPEVRKKPSKDYVCEHGYWNTECHQCEPLWPLRCELPPNLAAVCRQTRNDTLQLYRDRALREMVLQNFWDPPRMYRGVPSEMVIQTPKTGLESYIIICETTRSFSMPHIASRLNFQFRCHVSGKSGPEVVFCNDYPRCMHLGRSVATSELCCQYAGILAEGIAKLEQIQGSCERPFVVATILSRMWQCIASLLDLYRRQKMLDQKKPLNQKKTLVQKKTMAEEWKRIAYVLDLYGALTEKKIVIEKLIRLYRPQRLQVQHVPGLV